MGRLYLSLNQAEKAEKIYRYLMKMDSVNPNYPYQLAESLEKQNKLSEMGQRYLDAYNLDTLHIKSILGLAQFFKSLKFKDSTSLFIDKGLKIDPNNLNFNQLKANELYFLKDFNGALTYLKKLDSLKGVKPSDIIVSKVIHNSYNVYENYLTLNSGQLQGVKPDMGVINSLGIVGIVDNTSAHYATVISILNKKSLINAKIKKSDHFGSLTWDGKSTGYVQLIDVPRLATIRKGDTIVTGGQSVIFPENINIGTIERIYTDEETHYYKIEVKLTNT